MDISASKWHNCTLITRLSNAELIPWFADHDRQRMHLPHDLGASTIFIGTSEHGRFIPRATGFLVSYRHDDYYMDHLVTAEHVVSGILTNNKDVWVRFNLVDGGSGLWKVPSDSWYYHPDNRNRTDVAVSLITLEAQAEDGRVVRMAHRSFPINFQVGGFNLVASRDVIAATPIGLGDEVAVVGLFRSHFGYDRNIPVVRTGNIASLAQEPIFTKYAGHIEAYLIELRSIAGLSGSPAFVHLPPVRFFNGKVNQTRGSVILLLGLVHGHFDVQNLNEDIVTEDVAGEQRGINTGMGVVVPVDKIIETIEHPDLVKERSRIVSKLRAKKGAVADVDFDAADVHGVSSTHKEDFTSLLDAAARKKPQGD